MRANDKYKIITILFGCMIFSHSMRMSMLLLPGLVSVHNVHFYPRYVSTLNSSWKSKRPDKSGIMRRSQKWFKICLGTAHHKFISFTKQRGCKCVCMVLNVLKLIRGLYYYAYVITLWTTLFLSFHTV